MTKNGDTAMIRIMLSFVLAAALFGCAGVSTRSDGARVDKDKVNDIKPGTTTRQAVIDAFGTPSGTSSQDNEERLTYVFKETKTPSYLGGLVENEANTVRSSTTLDIVLKDGIVSSYRFKNSEN